MLALSQRRQHLPLHPHSTLPSPPSSQNISFDTLSQQLSAQTLFDQKLLHDYLESQQQTFATPVIVDNSLSSTSNLFMNGSFDFSNPTIRIQQSTPTPQLPAGILQPPMLSTNNVTASGLDNWHTFANNGHLDNQTLHTPVQSQAGRGHQRASSSSSIGSNASQYQSAGPTATYPPFSNHLPTPTHTPTQDSFTMNSNFNTYTSNTNMDSTMSAHYSMKHALMDGQHDTEDVPSFGHSARHSVSSYGHDSPATPHTAQGEDFDDRFKIPATDMRHTVPKFERTYTDVAADNFYDPSNLMPQSQTQTQSQALKPTSNASLLSPYRGANAKDILQRTVQAAQNARSQSPASSSSRPISPFRHSSPYRQPSNAFSSPRMRVPTAAQAREQKVEADAAYAMKQSVQADEAPKTMSPKDALLDYREADEQSKVPLFPEGGASEYEHNQYNGGEQYRNVTQSSFDTSRQQSYRRDSWATPQFAPNYSTTTSGPSSSTFAFVAPAVSGNMHGLPFVTSQYRAASSMPSASEPVPDFPAHLTSMESSASEAGPENQSSQQSEHLQKPASTTADSGTYTCTYHGCTLRFETPQKLQKHKREGHRNANAATVSSSMTSAALLERNSQAGPHKCERINPTTGKPCNTIFSRPYDLTRHEDTIHNARKQKVRCALCVEEKTFSRNDALTRHMRVVHPEIDFPGKHRRRGGNHD